MVHGDLHGRVTGYLVSAKDVSLCAGSDRNAIHIAIDDVVLNDIVVISVINESDAEVIPLYDISIPN